MTVLLHKVFIVPLLQKVSDTDCDYDSDSVALDAVFLFLLKLVKDFFLRTTDEFGSWCLWLVKPERGLDLLENRLLHCSCQLQSNEQIKSLLPSELLCEI